MKIVSNRIGWIDNHWIQNDELKLPIINRGQTLSDGIFETILILQNKPLLLKAHLNRWKLSAKVLGMASPPSKAIVEPLIHEAIERASLFNGNGALRLNWCRGNNNTRGINVSTTKKSSNEQILWLELNEHNPSFQPISTMISCHEARNAKSQINQCKTFAYLQSIQARHEANLAGYEDALLLSTNGEICCGATSNILVKRKGEWLTPRAQSGCLPGVMRQQGLKSGIFKEAEISPQPESNDQWLLINSLSCQPIYKINTTYLESYSEAEILWHSLLIEKI